MGLEPTTRARPDRLAGQQHNQPTQKAETMFLNIATHTDYTNELLRAAAEVIEGEFQTDEATSPVTGHPVTIIRLSTTDPEGTLLDLQSEFLHQFNEILTELDESRIECLRSLSNVQDLEIWP